MEVRPLQQKKAELPILVTEFGIIVFLHPAMSSLLDFLIIALQLLRESYMVFPLSTIMEVRPVHPPKA